MRRSESRSLGQLHRDWRHCGRLLHRVRALGMAVRERKSLLLCSDDTNRCDPYVTGQACDLRCIPAKFDLKRGWQVKVYDDTTFTALRTTMESFADISYNWGSQQGLPFTTRYD